MWVLATIVLCCLSLAVKAMTFESPSSTLPSTSFGGSPTSAGLSVSAQHTIHANGETFSFKPADPIDGQRDIRLAESPAIFDDAVPLSPFGLGAVSHGLICLASPECLYRSHFDRNAEPISGLLPSQINTLRTPYDQVIHGDTGSNAGRDVAAGASQWGILALTSATYRDRLVSAVPVPGAVWVMIIVATGLLVVFSAIRRGARK